MGFFSSIKEVAKEANEEAHGMRLEQGLEDTKRCLASLREDVRIGSIRSFVLRRRELLQQIPNWSLDGRLQAGKKLQNDARAKFDFDQSESYGLWMTGAWLESGCRNSVKARRVHGSLEGIALEVEGGQSHRPNPGAAVQQTRSRGGRVSHLVKLIRTFDGGWDVTLGIAAAMSGLREIPPSGDKNLAILWGAIAGLAQSIGADDRETMVATLKFLQPYPDAASVYRRMEQLSKDPSWRAWVEMAGRAVASHISGEADASKAYIPLAVQYLRTGGG